MKLGYFFIFTSLALGLASCEYKSEMDDLEGFLGVPVTAELSLSSYSAEMTESLTYFTLDFSSSTVSLHTVLAASLSATYLPANGYLDAYSSSAANGYFIIEDTYVTVSGSSKTIVDGTITVTASATDDADTYSYTVSTVIFDEDDTCYKLSWEGEMTYEGLGSDEDTDALTNLLYCTNYYSLYASWGWEYHLVSVEFGTDDITYSYDSSTYTSTYGGTGNTIRIEFYTAAGEIPTGTLTPSVTADDVAEGEFGIGYDGTYGVSGTTWFTYEDGTATSYEYVTDGTVTIEDNGDGTYTLTVDSSVVTVTCIGEL